MEGGWSPLREGGKEFRMGEGEGIYCSNLVSSKDRGSYAALILKPSETDL